VYFSEYSLHPSSFRPGQEEGNIPFVEEAGFGKYSGDASVIASTVSSWLESPDTLDTMRKSALAAARPQATLDIAKDLAEIVFAAKAKQRQGQRVAAASV
jgi:1,2-diacylglycerol 3-beta-galactosyltransferase